MPAYLIRHVKGHHGDIHLDDPDLRMETTCHWVKFLDGQGICFAVPIEQIASIQRVDEPQEQPAEE